MSGFPSTLGMFRPRSGRRPTGVQQQAANRANDSDSMRVDPVESRRNLRRQSLTRRDIEHRILMARQAGDIGTMRALQSQLQELSFNIQDDVRAINPRGTTADDLNRGRQRLIDSFPAAAGQAADASRGRADVAQGELDAEEARIGRGRIRSLGYNPDDVYGGNAERLGELSSGPEAVNYSGRDRRGPLSRRVSLAEQDADRLDAAGERGLRLSDNFNPEAIAARIKAEDEAALAMSFERQRRRGVATENNRADFNAADELADLGREDALISGRNRVDIGRAAGIGAKMNLADQESRLAGQPESLKRKLRTDSANEEVKARTAEGRLGMLGDQERNAGLRLDLEASQLRSAIDEFGAVTKGGDTLVDRNPEQFVGGLTDSWGHIASAFTKLKADGTPKQSGEAAGLIKFKDVPNAQIDLFSSYVSELEKAYSEGSPEARQAVQDIAWKITAEAGSLSGSTDTGYFEGVRAAGVLGSIADPWIASVRKPKSNASFDRSEPVFDSQYVAEEKIMKLNKTLSVLRGIANGDKTRGMIIRERSRRLSDEP